MRNFYYVLLICAFTFSCDKNENPDVSTNEIVKKELSKSEIILKDKLNQAAKIMSNLVQDKEIVMELQTISKENRLSYDLSFKDLLAAPKGVNDPFKKLRNSFMKISLSKGMTDGGNDLNTYLIENNCYIYCPYPDDFYPEGIASYTVAPHPVDNEYEGVGYLVDAFGKMAEIIVNEKYTDNNPVLLIMPNNKDNSDSLDLGGVKSTPNTKADPINEVTLGLIRCADYCGGLFEGTLELRVARGFPVFNTETEVATGSFSSVIAIDYPKDYAKAAINNWTAHSNGGWYPVNIPWDSNWKVEKDKQGVLVYEYDQSTTVSATVGVGYKKDPNSATVSATASTTYRGDFLGINEWDRSWFYSTNTNPGPYDEVKDGWVVRKTATVLKLTTPTRTLK
jgi:hypothetical protein